MCRWVLLFLAHVISLASQSPPARVALQTVSARPQVSRSQSWCALSPPNDSAETSRRQFTHRPWSLRIVGKYRERAATTSSRRRATPTPRLGPTPLHGTQQTRQTHARHTVRRWFPITSRPSAHPRETPSRTQCWLIERQVSLAATLPSNPTPTRS